MFTFLSMVVLVVSLPENDVPLFDFSASIFCNAVNFCCFALFPYLNSQQSTMVDNEDDVFESTPNIFT